MMARHAVGLWTCRRLADVSYLIVQPGGSFRCRDLVCCGKEQSCRKVKLLISNIPPPDSRNLALSGSHHPR
jgi:hypothetical protein